MTNLLALLQEFRQEKLVALLRHQAGALAVSQYDTNNTYQYVINREEGQIAWLDGAIVELGGTPQEAPAVDRPVAGRRADAMRSVLEEDARDSQAFVDRWQPRVAGVTNARQRGMLRIILGETLEQKRFFEQALAGCTDLLGRRAQHLPPASGEVLATRWIE